MVVGRIQEFKINLVFLLETRVKENKMKAIINRHFQGWQMVHNYFEKLAMAEYGSYGMECKWTWLI